ncbi:MAG: hypothetical protein LQ338_004943 [Usnochroma carphineum]|nr:MAG: hypothetical protein LQ338_004943 [Usnochroma carphineum]
MPEPSGFRRVPVEVVEQIIQYLDIEQPTTLRRIRYEPSAGLLDSDLKPLKNLSLTCRSLRNLVFHSLFQFLRLGFDDLTPQTAKGYNADNCLKELYKLSRFVSRFGLAGKIRGLAFFFPVETEFGLHYLHDFRHKLLSFALGEMNPESLTLIASATVLGEISQLEVNEHDMWAFKPRVHILNLRQPPELAGPDESTRRISWGMPSTLFNLRPWSCIALNEGSCLSVYSTYEYHLKSTPSIMLHPSTSSSEWPHLGAILPHARHFDYIANFPLSKHMANLAYTLCCMPQLVSLSTQFTPAPDVRDNILEDSREIGKASISDVWMEAAQAYRTLAASILTKGIATELRRWTALDYSIPVDDIVGAVFQGRGWERKEARVWEKVRADHEDEASSNGT